MSRSRAGQQIESPRIARYGSVFSKLENPALRDRLFTGAPQADVTHCVLVTAFVPRILIVSSVVPEMSSESPGSARNCPARGPRGWVNERSSTVS